MKTNFKTAIILFLSVVTLSLTSCSEEEEKDITVEVVDTYTGVLNVADGYQSTNYSVTVTKVNNTKLKITPQDSNATAFEVDIMEGTNSAIVAVNSTATFSVTFTNTAGEYSLSYIYTNSNDKAEEFTGNM